MSNTNKKYEHALLLLWLDFMYTNFSCDFYKLTQFIYESKGQYLHSPYSALQVHVRGSIIMCLETPNYIMQAASFSYGIQL